MTVFPYRRGHRWHSQVVQTFNYPPGPFNVEFGRRLRSLCSWSAFLGIKCSLREFVPGSDGPLGLPTTGRHLQCEVTRPPLTVGQVVLRFFPAEAVFRLGRPTGARRNCGRGRWAERQRFTGVRYWGHRYGGVLETGRLPQRTVPPGLRQRVWTTKSTGLAADGVVILTVLSSVRGALCVVRVVRERRGQGIGLSF
jgi:hypothetical protein